MEIQFSYPARVRDMGKGSRMLNFPKKYHKKLAQVSCEPYDVEVTVRVLYPKTGK